MVFEPLASRAALSARPPERWDMRMSGSRVDLLCFACHDILLELAQLSVRRRLGFRELCGPSTSHTRPTTAALALFYKCSYRSYRLRPKSSSWTPFERFPDLCILRTHWLIFAENSPQKQASLGNSSLSGMSNTHFSVHFTVRFPVVYSALSVHLAGALLVLNINYRYLSSWPVCQCGGRRCGSLLALFARFSPCSYLI